MIGREKDGSGTAGTGGCFWTFFVGGGGGGGRGAGGVRRRGKAVSAALPDFDCLVDAARHDVRSRPVEI